MKVKYSKIFLTWGNVLSECEIGNSHYKILDQILFDLGIYNRKWNKMFTVDIEKSSDI